MILNDESIFHIRILYVFLLLAIRPLLADENKTSDMFNGDDDSVTEDELQTEHPISETEYKLLEQILESFEKNSNNNNNESDGISESFEEEDSNHNESDGIAESFEKTDINESDHIVESIEIDDDDNEYDINSDCRRRKRSISDYKNFWNNLKTLGIGVSGDIGIGLRLGSGDNEIVGMKRVTHTNNVYDRYIGTNFHTIINGHLGHNSQEQESSANALLYKPVVTNGQSTTTPRTNNNQGGSTNQTNGPRLLSNKNVFVSGEGSTLSPDVELLLSERRNEKFRLDNVTKSNNNNDEEKITNSSQSNTDSDGIEKNSTISTIVETKEMLNDELTSTSSTPRPLIMANNGKNSKKKSPSVFQKILKYFNKSTDKPYLRLFKQNETLSKVFEKFFSKYLSRNPKTISNNNKDYDDTVLPLSFGTKDRLIPYVHRRPRSINNIDQSNNTELQSKNQESTVNFRNFILNMAGQYLLSLPDEQQDDGDDNNETNIVNTRNDDRLLRSSRRNSSNIAAPGNGTVFRIKDYLLNTPVAEMMKHALQEFQKISLNPDIKEDSVWGRIINYFYNNPHQNVSSIPVA